MHSPPISAFKSTLLTSHYQTKTLKKNTHTMQVPHHLSLLLLLLSWLSPRGLTQNTITDCGPSLLPLAPCGPFVQGKAAAPVKACCDNVDMLSKRNLTCLCALLGSSGSVSLLPINVSLALQLPLLCKLSNVSPSLCPGITLPSLSPPTKVPFGAKPHSGGVAASPMVAGSPSPRFMGFGFHPSADQTRLEADSRMLLLLLLLAAVFQYKP